MSIDGTGLRALTIELSTLLSGSRIERIFQPDEYSLFFEIRKPGTTYKLIMSVNPQHPHIRLTDSSPENPSSAPTFCMLLRKHLIDGRIALISQQHLDRVIEIHIDTLGEKSQIFTKKIIIEIMGKHSNIILTQDDIIIDAIRRIGLNTSRLRQILPRLPYHFPPGQLSIDLLTSPQIYIQHMMNYSSDHLTLAKVLMSIGSGIGPYTAREIAWRAGLPHDMAWNKLDIQDLNSLSTAIQNLSEQFSPHTSTALVFIGPLEKPVAISPFSLEHLSSHTTIAFSSVSKALSYFYKQKKLYRLPEKEILRRLTQHEIQKLQKKLPVLEADWTESQNADEFRLKGDLLMTCLHQLNTGQTEAVLPDLFSESVSSTILISLDPLLTPLANAQSYYNKYTKYKRAQDIIMAQLTHCQQTIEYLESIAVAIELANTTEELLPITQELKDAGYIKSAKKTRLPAVAKPLSGTTSSGLVLSVGKNNRQNDHLTFKTAHANDMWFHTKNIPGSHVILHCGNIKPSEKDLWEAAQLAAFHSKAQKSSSVPVDYTFRRYVKKPSGSPPGFVIYDHQHTIQVTPDESIVKELLKLQD